METFLGTLLIYCATLGTLLFTAYGSLLCWSSHLKEPTPLLKIMAENLKIPFNLLAECVIYEIGKSKGDRRFLFIRGMLFRLVTTVPILVVAFGIFYSGAVLIIEGNWVSGFLIEIICSAMIVHTVFAWTFGRKLSSIESG